MKISNHYGWKELKISNQLLGFFLFDSQEIVPNFQHAHALESLKDQLIAGEKALDVGSGSGYLTACMAFMVGETGRVVGIEHIPELVTMATKNIQNDNPQLLISERIKLIGKNHVPNYSYKNCN